MSWRGRLCHWGPWAIPKFIALRDLERRATGKLSWMEKHKLQAQRFRAPRCVSWIRVHHAKRWLRGATFPRPSWVNPETQRQAKGIA